MARVRALDGTWHRPFTTAELCALQSLIDPEEQAELDGLSDADWRERFGAIMAEHMAGGGLIVAAVHDPLPIPAQAVEIAP